MPDTVSAPAAAKQPDPPAPTTVAASPPAAVTPPVTVASGGTGEEMKGPATWPDDWRVKLAGEDKDALKTLDRFADPGALYKSYTELRRKLDDPAKTAAKPPESPEELKTWRAANGIPAESIGYVDALKLPDGKVLGDADKPVAEEVAKVMHAHNINPAAYGDLVKWYFDRSERMAAEADEADAELHDTTDRSLREEWGGDFKRNVNAIATIFPSADLRDRLLAGRTADGKIIGDDPEVVKFLAGLALDLNPAMTVLNGGNGGPTSVTDRLAELKEMMKSNPDKYWSPAIQAEELRLIEAQQKMSARAGKAA